MTDLSGAFTYAVEHLSCLVSSAQFTDRLPRIIIKRSPSYCPGCPLPTTARNFRVRIWRFLCN